MPRPFVLIAEYMDDGGVRALQQDFAVHYDPDLFESPAELHRLIGGARALIVRNRTQVTAELLARAPALRVIGRLGVGLDNIDLDTCRTRGIAVHHAPGANAQAVAEYALAMTLVTLRGSYGATAEVAAGAWPRAALGNGGEAAGRTLGLVGFGDIGQRTARLARAIGLGVVAYDPAHGPDAPVWQSSGVECVDLPTLLARADAVSLHLPLNPATRGLFGRDTLARMRPGAVLINTARGGIVDEAALADALRRGHLSGAALDVFAHEPLPSGSPLAGLPNVWLTPHVAGLTREANRRIGTQVAEQVRNSLSSPA
ncbi:hydroxyacid dehydrogenase [Pseudothauera rhizosphaerae]|uniref:Hydroxyacid dehydrogenase n=1 Tax=Pseudothauera rhizosphaerae TaxID=2565932 RepID=A0A4S4ALV5_9RHOO|nr:hydroxyacid dehydrogenase [Pseudothauera rhizosphaerae]THF60517.1 hydroxyacid dehydrogenase [Pseudothauera rhizosphaerae]